MDRAADTMRIPRHIAIILDGNGRWAAARNLPRVKGHAEGVKRVEEIVAEARRVGVQALTVYAFSTENWQRPKTEVAFIMNTLTTFLHKKVAQFNKSNIRLRVIGSRTQLPKAVLASMDDAVAQTKNNTGLLLNLAFNYGARMEIVEAVRVIAGAVAHGHLAVDAITEKTIDDALYTHGIPDPDLLIRTSGEQRISNFLLWQLSYAEFYFTKKYWPDFTIEEFHKALADYQKRERRYGTVSAKDNAC